jgi:hypothetical protein
MWGSMDESMHSLPTISQAGASVSDLSRPPQRGLSGGGQLFARMGKGPVREHRAAVRRACGRLAYFFWPGVSSYGAPVPDDPMNSFFPSANVMSRPLARFEPSLAR